MNKMIDSIGFLANLTSLILWIPQATKTWRNRNDPYKLSGISVVTQIIVIINTSLWCIYGLLIDNFWLPLGTIIIFPLAVLTILLKIRSKNIKNNECHMFKEYKWFTFQAYQELDTVGKEKCLLMMYTTDFHKQIRSEQLNWESYESMDRLNRMYWNKDLWRAEKLSEKESI